LPRIIAAQYGKPDAIFAPNPSQQKDDHGTRYDYVRPLATVEPAAVFFGMPVNASIGFSQIDRLRDALLSPAYRNSVVLVGWEHTQIEKLARELVKQFGGDPAVVPRWQSGDFDSIYLLRITRNAQRARAAFSVEQQGLSNLPAACPGG
jgi:hypothetical protein